MQDNTYKRREHIAAFVNATLKKRTLPPVCSFLFLFFIIGLPPVSDSPTTPNLDLPALLSDAELVDDGAVALDVDLLEIAEQVAAVTNHLE